MTTSHIQTSTRSSRRFLARAIRFVALAASLRMLWTVVPVFRGELDDPLARLARFIPKELDAFSSWLLGIVFPDLPAQPYDLASSPMGIIAASVVCVGLAIIVAEIGVLIARAVEVGPHRLWIVGSRRLFMRPMPARDATIAAGRDRQFRASWRARSRDRH